MRDLKSSSRACGPLKIRGGLKDIGASGGLYVREHSHWGLSPQLQSGAGLDCTSWSKGEGVWPGLANNVGPKIIKLGQ